MTEDRSKRRFFIRDFYCNNCLNKILASDWFSAAPIYCLPDACQNCHLKLLVIRQVKSDSRTDNGN